MTPRLVDVAGVVELQHRLTGRRPAPATIRSYHSRGLMPAQVEPGRWAAADIQRWLRRRRPRPSPAAVSLAGEQLRRQHAITLASGDRAALDEAVIAARRQNVSWQTIAEAIGVSPQAMWRRLKQKQ